MAVNWRRNTGCCSGVRCKAGSKNLFASMRIDPRRARVEHMKTTSGGGRQAVSLGGSVTGFGADVIVIDYLTKASDVQSEVILKQALVFF